MFYSTYYDLEFDGHLYKLFKRSEWESGDGFMLFSSPVLDDIYRMMFQDMMISGRKPRMTIGQI